jgi:glycosyltransferase involved in cell wall biosynthesis
VGGSTAMSGSGRWAPFFEKPIPLFIIVLCAAMFHIPLLIMHLPTSSYDAYFHMSMASHYAHHWFDPWNPKQLGGFSQTTYPPLTHQWTALLSKLFGLENAYMLVQGVVILLLPLAVLRFSHIWVDARAASYAAFCSTFVGSLCELVYQDGQIGTTSSTTLFLLALPSLYAYILHGRKRDLTYGLALWCTASAAHHATLIFGTAFFVAPLVWRAFSEYRIRYPKETLRKPLMRLAIAAGTAALGVVIVLFPYLASLRKNPIKQVPIPHQSRANFILSPFWGVHYWVIPFGIFILALPYIFIKGTQRRYLPLFLGFYFALLFGLGGTTPVPRWILGRAFAVLTFERFTLWAVLLALPFAGMLISVLLDRYGTKAAVLVSLALFLNASAAIAEDAFVHLRGQPVDVSSVVHFLNTNGHDKYRYVTLGFGRAISHIDCYTSAWTVDGEYNSARTLPEMTRYGAAEFTSSKYFGRRGLQALSAMLGHADHYGLKYIFVLDSYYNPLLTFAGWRPIANLDNGRIQVWSTIGIAPARGIQSPYRSPAWQGILWGTIPFGVSLIAIVMTLLRLRKSHDSEDCVHLEESVANANEISSYNHIALVTAFPPGRGDLSEYGFQLARVLRESYGVRPTIFADLHREHAEELPGYTVIRCWRFNSIVSFIKLIGAIRRAQPDVVWFNIGLSTMANKPAAALAASAIPWLLHIIGFNTHITLHAFSENVDFEHAGVRFPKLYQFGARLATRLLLLTDGVHVLLPSYREKIVSTFHSVGRKVFVHSHGIFNFPPDNSSVERVPGVVLAFGSWGTYKRLEALIEAFKTLRTRIPTAQLWIAGGDHPKARGYLAACSQGLHDPVGISFLGYIEEPCVANLFKRVSLAVLPYSSSAGSSGVVHLACECSVPVLASDILDLRELATFEGLWLEFFPPDAVDVLADQLLRLLSDPRSQEDMAVHNRRAVQTLSLQNIAGDYLRIFAETRRAAPRINRQQPGMAPEEPSSPHVL